MATAWLAAQGVEQPPVLLAATGGAPLEALRWQEEGITAQAWSGLPQALQQGRADALSGWPAPRVLDALMKWGHDALATTLGGQSTFFPKVDPVPRMGPLMAWLAQVRHVAAHADHPWHEPLLVDSLVEGAREAVSR